MFDLNLILFTVGGTAVTLFELLSTVIGLLCVFLAGRGKVANFWFGYIYNILLFVLVAQKHLYFSMALQPISFAINAVGHYRWTHPSREQANKQNQLKVTTLKTPVRVWGIVCIILLTLGLGFGMQRAGVIAPDKFPPAELPFLDAFKIIVILTAQYLSAHKKLECWYIWMISNTTNIILYILSGLLFMPIVCAVYLVLAFVGFAGWRKTMKEQ